MIKKLLNKENATLQDLVIKNLRSKTEISKINTSTLVEFSKDEDAA